MSKDFRGAKKTSVAHLKYTNVAKSIRLTECLSDGLVTSSILQGRPQKKPANSNCWLWSATS